MRTQLLAVMILAGAAPAALAQTNGNPQNVPTAIGNRANGNSYQPTPSETVPREKAAGIAPSATQQRQTNNELWHADSSLLKSEGLSGKSVPSNGTPTGR